MNDTVRLICAGVGIIGGACGFATYTFLLISRRQKRHATHPVPEQILAVLNGGEPVDCATLRFCVITGIIASEHRHDYWPFIKGELLVLGGGRELFGDHRKPAKWDVITFTAVDFGQARALSQLVKSDAKRGLWEWDGTTWSYCAGCGLERRGEPSVAWVGDAPDRAKVWQQ